MKRRLLLSAAVVLIAACQETRPAQRSNSGGPIASPVDQRVPALPAIPATIDLDTYAWGTPLYPRGTESAYAVYRLLPTDSTRFEVYGFDPKRRVAVFHGQGGVRKSYAASVDQINRDLAAIRGIAPNVKGGIFGQVDPKPPPQPPGPVIDELKAWQMAYNGWTADSQQVRTPIAQ